MQRIRSAILKHMRVSNSFVGYGRQHFFWGSIRPMCTSGKCDYSGQIMERVVGLVKKYDKIDAMKVTETADFQKDLSLDSLDRTELIMAFEEEFSIEIPDEKADKFACCADVTKYISEAKSADSGNHT